jgi:hypothetical protein
MVSVEIDEVPLEHHDVPCLEPTEQNAINGMNELISAQENEEPISVVNVDHQEKANGELAFDVPSELNRQSETVSAAVTYGGSEEADDTDNDLWSGKRSRVRKELDNRASVVLLDIIKERWEAVTDKKVSRAILFTSIAREMRARGIKISRKPEKVWSKVYDRWNNIKRSYTNFSDSLSETGKGASAPPPFYEELQELMGIENLFVTCFICSFRLLI